MVAKRVQRPAPVVKPSAKAQLPTMAELAEAERLVTVIPPKTRQTLIRTNSGDLKKEPFFALDGSAASEAIMVGTQERSLEPEAFVKGRFANEHQSVVRNADKRMHAIASAGWDDRDPNQFTREELDAWFKATNQAIFRAIGKRPKIFFYHYPGSVPTQDVVDYAAINGMVTIVATGPEGDFPVITRAEEFLETPRGKVE